MKLKKTLIMAAITAAISAFILAGCTKQVTLVSLDKETLEVTHGETFVLNATILPDDAENKSVTWNIDSSNVSAVTNENTLQKEFSAASVGTARVKVVSANGKSAFCDVTVTENEEDIAARQKAEEEEKIAAEKKAEEERIAAEKEAEEERLSYETGITYDQLARTPDDYKWKKVKFYGRVIQVLEGDGETDLRIATKPTSYGSYYDDIILVYYDPSITPSRVLEDDMVTIYGLSRGLHSYESPLGLTITLPLISVSKIEIE